MAKIVNLNGTSELLFIEIAEQEDRKAIGLKNAVIKAIKTNFDEPISSYILTKISSLYTDGTNVNKGAKSSLWTHFEKKLKLPIQRFFW